MPRIEPGPQSPIQPGTEAEQRLVDAVRGALKTVVVMSETVDPLAEIPSTKPPSDGTLAERLGKEAARELLDNRYS